MIIIIIWAEKVLCIRERWWKRFIEPYKEHNLAVNFFTSLFQSKKKRKKNCHSHIIILWIRTKNKKIPWKFQIRSHKSFYIFIFSICISSLFRKILLPIKAGYGWLKKYARIGSKKILFCHYATQIIIDHYILDLVKNLKNELSESLRPTPLFRLVKRGEPTLESEFKTSTQSVKNSRLNGSVRRVGLILPPLTYIWNNTCDFFFNKSN